MNDQTNQKWEKHWTGENQSLTWIGKQMLRSKQKALEEVLKDIKPANAIDAGCALGYTLSVFKNAGINTRGIDVSQTAVDICKNKGLNAFQKKIEDITITDKYDLVFSDGMLEHFLNFEPYAQKMAAISSRYVCIIQTDHSSFWGKTSIYLAELLRDSKNVLEYNYRINDFVSIFEKNNFKLIFNRGIFLNIFRLLLFEKVI